MNLENVIFGIIKYLMCIALLVGVLSMIYVSIDSFKGFQISHYSDMGYLFFFVMPAIISLIGLSLLLSLLIRIKNK